MGIENCKMITYWLVITSHNAHRYKIIYNGQSSNIKIWCKLSYWLHGQWYQKSKLEWHRIPLIKLICNNWTHFVAYSKESVPTASHLATISTSFSPCSEHASGAISRTLSSFFSLVPSLSVFLYPCILCILPNMLDIDTRSLSLSYRFTLSLSGMDGTIMSQSTTFVGRFS